MDQNPADDDAVQKRSGQAIKRYALIAVPLFVAVAVFFAIFWPKIEINLWINGLHSDSPEIRRTMRGKLLDAARKDPGVVDEIADAIQDEDRGFHVRQSVVGILIELGRMKAVLDTYATGDLPARAVILSRMLREREFKEYWAEDSSLAVRETVRKWLGTTTGPISFDRSHAVQVAIALEMKDSMPLIRPLLTRLTANVHEDKKRDMLIAAAAAVVQFGDCESMPKLVALARADSNFLVRVRALQDVERAAFADGALCKDSISEDEMRALVKNALHDETKEVRMASMLILEKRPDWAAGSLPRLKEILAGKMAEGMQGTERRHALQALIGTRDPAFLSELPKYFLDPNPSIRSSCASKAVLFHVSGPRLESCLIGLVRNEVERVSVFNAALEGLRQAAGKWYGLPKKIAEKVRGGDRKVLHKAMQSMFTTGATDDVRRDDMVAAWFAWLCADLGLDATRTERMQAARVAFWAAADQNDAKGALAALAALPSAPAGLFLYEQSWLALHKE